MTKPIAVIMVGVPNSGKTTFRKEQGADYKVLSTDEYIERYAKEHNKHYLDVVGDQTRKARDKLYEELDEYILAEESFIWDQNNLTVANRKTILESIPRSIYEVICIVIETSEDKIYKRNKRVRGRNLSLPLMRHMLKIYMKPTEDEGFDKLIFISGEE